MILGQGLEFLDGAVSGTELEVSGVGQAEPEEEFVGAGGAVNVES